MAAVYSNVIMDVKDVRTVEKVFADMEVELKVRININEIIISLRKLNFIDDVVHKRFSDNYTMTDMSEGKALVRFNRFLWEISDFLSFEQLLTVFCDSGYQNITNRLLSVRGNSKLEIKPKRDQMTRMGAQNIHTEIILYHPTTSYFIEAFTDYDETTRHSQNEIPRPISRYRLPHAGYLNRFYIDLKVQVDNNSLNNGLTNGTRTFLEQMISNLDTMISSCENPGRLQLLLDKRVVLYFLLVQLCADFDERMNILRRLHDSMPHGVDRTMFNAIYHSNMAVSWAMKGNITTALEHVAIAREDSCSCSPCLPVYVAMIGAHITHTEIYLCDRSEDYLKKALMDHENVSQLVKEASQEEQIVWKSGTLLIMASAWLGIKYFSKVCEDNACRDIENVEKARHILAAVRQLKSLSKHRELMLYVCIGKLHDIDGNINDAVKYIRKARTLADGYSSNITEKSNISAYLSRLQNQAGYSCFNMTRRPGEIPNVMYYFGNHLLRSLDEHEETPFQDYRWH